jgi:hypothetical protein
MARWILSADLGTRDAKPRERGAMTRLILAILVAGVSLTAQTADPTTLPLLTEKALQYVGAFRLPATSTNGTDFSFGGRVMAFNPASGSLFVTSRWGAVAEISIPAPVNSADINALPFATYLQPFVDPTEGHLAQVGTDGINVVGLLVSGSQLIGTASIYYDANNTQAVSHFSRSLQLDQKSFSGWSQVWDQGRQGYVAGWMANVPSEWQARLGGPALTGQCCIPIVSRTSVGMAAFAFDPAKVGQPKVPASPLLYYTQDHTTLGKWEGSNAVYGATTSIAGMAVIAGTRSVLYLGRNGTGPHCYGDATPNKALADASGGHLCYNPFTSDKGSHAYPYNYQVWAYDLNDFAAVKAGKKKPWDMKPYAVWSLKLPIGSDAPTDLGGVAYDAQRQLLHVSQIKLDPNGNAAIVHTFKLTIE